MLISETPLDLSKELKQVLFKKNIQINLGNSIYTTVKILKNILSYTSTLKKKSSIFDLTLNQLSDTDSESEESEEDLINKINLDNYIEKIVKHLDFDEHLLILSLMNLDKFLASNFVLSELNIQKVFFVCSMVTQKFYDDEIFTTKDYAKLCNVSVNELLEMEIYFLNSINFNLFIKDDDFNKYKRNFEKFMEDFIINF